MNTKLYFLFILSVLFFVVSSCKDDKDTNGNADDIKVEIEQEQLVYPLPTPFEVTQMLKKSGTPYSVDLTAPVSNAESYLKESGQALNLGVYGADLAYASTYNQAQSVRDILSASKILSDELGLTSVIDQNIMTRIEENIENQDSLYKIVNNTYYETFNKLNSENKGAISVLVITGGWIESLYLATQLAITSEDKTLLMNNVAKQKFNANALLPLLEQYQDNNDVAKMIPIVEDFKTVFDNVKVDSLENVSIDEATFNEITELSKNERNKIVSM